jgi:hypothetical protein
MMPVSKDLQWLSRWTVEYHSYTDDAMGMVEDSDELGKLSRGFSSAYICRYMSKHEPKTGNNSIVEGVHMLFFLGLHRDARVKQGAR